MDEKSKRPSSEGREECWVRLDDGFGLDALACLLDPRTETYHFKLNGKTYCLLIEKVVFDGEGVPEFGKHCLLTDYPLWLDEELEEARGVSGDLRPLKASRPLTLGYCWDEILFCVAKALKEALGRARERVRKWRALHAKRHLRNHD